MDTLLKLAKQVSFLTRATREYNPGIGAGMLNQLIEESEYALKEAKDNVWLLQRAANVWGIYAQKQLADEKKQSHTEEWEIRACQKELDNAIAFAELVG